MKIAELTRAAQRELEAAGVEDARLTAEVLLAHALGRTATWVRAFQDEDVPAPAQEKFHSAVARRAAHEPLEYITGYKPFCALDIKVTPSVLIPRPETEQLAAEVIKQIKTPSRVLDLCTGSGALACVMACKFPHAEVVAADISEDALAVAKENFAAFGLENVTPVRSDLFKNIDGEFDLILTNPPYIPEGDLPALDAHVRMEPSVALNGGADGLDIIRRIAVIAPGYLKSGGLLAMEFGVNQGAKILPMFQNKNWKTAELKKDIFSLERFLFSLRG